MASPQILDLNTLIERPAVNIDGARYELFSADELSVFESHWFTAKGQAIEAAAKEDDQAAVEQLVGEVARRCLVAVPDAVFDKLSGSQLMAISEVFTRLLLQRKVKVAGAIAAMVMESAKTGRKAKSPTGAKSSPASSAFSAATPGGGSTAPRRPS